MVKILVEEVDGRCASRISSKFEARGPVGYQPTIEEVEDVEALTFHIQLCYEIFTLKVKVNTHVIISG